MSEETTEIEVFEDTGPDEWDRRKGESGQAHAAFIIHRDTPPHLRNWVTTARAYYEKPELKSAPGRIRTWAEDWEWDKRVAAWDNYRQHVKDLRLMEDQSKDNDVVRVQAQDIRDMALQAILAKDFNEETMKTLALVAQVFNDIQKGTYPDKGSIIQVQHTGLGEAVGDAIYSIARLAELSRQNSPLKDASAADAVDAAIEEMIDVEAFEVLEADEQDPPS